jgi:hypothetical protein
MASLRWQEQTRPYEGYVLVFYDDRDIIRSRSICDEPAL